ncbi:hypothetical protein RCL1_003667 [Eukaryota sp. TZLM3-RCL]
MPLELIDCAALAHHGPNNVSSFQDDLVFSSSKGITLCKSLLKANRTISSFSMDFEKALLHERFICFLSGSSIVVYSLETLSPLSEFSLSPQVQPTDVIAFSLDDNEIILATATSLGEIYFFKVDKNGTKTNNDKLKVYSLPLSCSSPIISLSYSSSRLLALTDKGVLSVLSVSSSSSLSLSTNIMLSSDTIFMTANDVVAAVCHVNGRVSIVDVVNHRIVITIDLVKMPTCIAIKSDSNSIKMIVGCEDTSVSLFSFPLDFSNYSLVGVKYLTNAVAAGVSFIDGKFVVVTAESSKLAVFDENFA